MDPKAQAGFNMMETDEKKLGPPPSYSAAVPRYGNASAARRGNTGLMGVPPSGFYVKKWILLVTIFFNLLGFIVGLFAVDFVAQLLLNRSVVMGKLEIEPGNEEETLETFKKIVFTLLIVFILGSILFLYGIAKEHLGLATGYTVISFLVTISMALRCVANPASLLDTLLCIVTACVAYSFMKDLRKMRDSRIRMGLDVIYTINR